MNNFAYVSSSINDNDIDPREDAPSKLNEQRIKGQAQPNVDELESSNLGYEELPRIIKIGTTLTQSERSQLLSLLQDNLEAFAWSY